MIILIGDNEKKTKEYIEKIIDDIKTYELRHEVNSDLDEILGHIFLVAQEMGFETTYEYWNEKKEVV